MPFAAAHEIATALEQDIRGELGSEAEVETHIEPLEARVLTGEDASADRLAEIERLLSDIAADGPLTEIHNVRVRVNDDGIFVAFHCQVDGARSVEFVHAAVDRLEKTLREEAAPGAAHHRRRRAARAPGSLGMQMSVPNGTGDRMILAMMPRE